MLHVLCALCAIEVAVALDVTSRQVGQETTPEPPIPFVDLSNPFLQRTITEGRQQYEMIARQSQDPRLGSCWKSALLRLESGCPTLTDTGQSRIALELTSCFLETNGLPGMGCTGEDEDVGQCVRMADVKAFTAYTHFFTHAQSICFYLTIQLWQEEAQKTVDSLVANSAKVGAQLANASRLQQQLLEAQHQVLENQEGMIDSGRQLEQALDFSIDAVKDISGHLEDFKENTEGQRAVLMEVFQRVRVLQGSILGDTFWLYTAAFYIGMAVASYVATASRRTSEARFWLVVALTANAVMEWVVSGYFAKGVQAGEAAEKAQVTMHSQIWTLRYLTLAACASILLWFAYRFQNYNLINNHILVEIQEQNKTIISQNEKIISCVEDLSMSYSPAAEAPKTLPISTSMCLLDQGTPATDDTAGQFRLPTCRYNLRRSNASRSCTPTPTPKRKTGSRTGVRKRHNLENSAAEMPTSDEDSYLHEWD